jgi:hypothetical protein
MTTVYGLLADLIVGIHVGYVGVVVFGLLAILIGGPLGWRWVRNPWFRVIHLLMILIVATEAIWNITCPLTTWEAELRVLACQSVSEEPSFIGRMLHAVIFLPLPLWVFNVIHVLFALLILSTFWITPVRWRRPRPPVPEEPAACEARR